MKKILYLFFTCSIIFAFAGCSPSKKDSAEATTTQEIATTTSTTENTTDSSTSDSDAKNDSFYNIILSIVDTYQKLTPQSQEVIRKFIDQSLENIKKREG